MIPLSVAIVCASALVGVRWLLQYLDGGRVHLQAKDVDKAMAEMSNRMRELEIRLLKGDF